jgi:aminoglycoside phosphotransferase (APT) family kinase protein
LALPAALEDLTPQWIGAALTEGGQFPTVTTVDVRDVVVSRIGQDTGFLGQIARLTIDYAVPPPEPATPPRPRPARSGAANNAAGRPDGLPRTVVAKLPTNDPGGRVVGSMLDVWQREHRFFAELAERCAPYVPRCWYNGADPAAGRWALLLEDRGAGPPPDQVRGADDDQAHEAVEALGRLQARFAGGPAPVDWLPSFARPGFGPLQSAMAAAVPAFVERHGHRVPPRTLAWLTGFVDRLPAWAAEQGAGPLTLVHADYRLDNLLFGPDGSVTVLDWQTALWGPGPMDLASLLATSLTVPDRRRLERQLIGDYVAASVGTTDRPLVERCYRSCLLWWMAIFANNLSRLDPADDRSRALFEAMIDRTYQAADDWDAGALLPT